jgi:hypothetical protein
VLILDFDATDTPVQGRQEGRFFRGYYDCYCFPPAVRLLAQGRKPVGASQIPGIRLRKIAFGIASRQKVPCFPFLSRRMRANGKAVRGQSSENPEHSRVPKRAAFKFGYPISRCRGILPGRAPAVSLRHPSRSLPARSTGSKTPVRLNLPPGRWNDCDQPALRHVSSRLTFIRPFRPKLSGARKFSVVRVAGLPFV